MGNTEWVNGGIGRTSWRVECLAGVTVAFALLPEALAFAILVGLSPLIGLYTAFIIGMITTLLGTRAGMISGATGAVAVMLVSLGHTYGPEYVFAAVILAGVLQVIGGLLNVGRLRYSLTPSVMTGFLNGLGIILFLSQLRQFQYIDQKGVAHFLALHELRLPLLLTGLSIMVVFILPRFVKGFPPALAAIILLTILVWVFHLPVNRVREIAVIHGGLPQLHIPAGLFSWKTLSTIFPFSAGLAAVGLIESLLTLAMLDRLEERNTPANREVFVQGAGNLVAGFFAGMGGCAMTGQTRLNYTSGGRTRLSGLVAAMMLMVFILVGAPVIELIPMSALTGIMIVIAVTTFQWKVIPKFREWDAAELVIIVLVTATSVVFDNLALGVLLGVASSIIMTKIRAHNHGKQNNTPLHRS
jgi:SulP family sulfate permease